MPATSANPELATAALSKLGSLPDPVQKKKHTRLLLTAWTVYPPEKSGSILMIAVLPGNPRVRRPLIPLAGRDAEGEVAGQAAARCGLSVGLCGDGRQDEHGQHHKSPQSGPPLENRYIVRQKHVGQLPIVPSSS